MLQAQMEEQSRVKQKRQQPAKRRNANRAANAEYTESQPRDDRGHLFEPATHGGGGHQLRHQKMRQQPIAQFQNNPPNLPSEPGYGNVPNFPMQREHVPSTDFHVRSGHVNPPNWSTGFGHADNFPMELGHANPPHLPTGPRHANPPNQHPNFGRFQPHPNNQIQNERERLFRGNANFSEHQPTAANHVNPSVFPKRDGPPNTHPDSTNVNPILGSQPQAPSVPRFNWPPGEPRHTGTQPAPHPVDQQHMGDPARPRDNISARSNVENNSNARGAMNDLSKRQKQLKQREWLDHQKREREMAAENARAEKIQQRARIRELRRKRTPRRPTNGGTTNTRTTSQSPGYGESPRGRRGLTNADRPPQPAPDPTGPVSHSEMRAKNTSVGAPPHLLGHTDAHSNPQSHLQSGSPRKLAHHLQSQSPRQPPMPPHMQRTAGPPPPHSHTATLGNEFGVGKFSGRGNRSDLHDAPDDQHWDSHQRTLHNPHHRAPVHIHSAQQLQHENSHAMSHNSPRHLTASPLTVVDPWSAREAPPGRGPQRPPSEDRGSRQYEPPVQLPHPEGAHTRSPSAISAQNMDSRFHPNSNSSRTSPSHNSRHPGVVSADSRASVTGDRSPPGQPLPGRGHAQNILHPPTSSASPHSSHWRTGAGSGQQIREGLPSHQIERAMDDARYKHDAYATSRVLDVERSVAGPVPHKEPAAGWSGGDDRANLMRRTQLLDGDSEYRAMTAEDALNATRISDDEEECMPLQSFSTLYTVNPDQLYQSIAIDFRDKGVPVPESLSSYRQQQKQPAQVQDRPAMPSIMEYSPTSPGRGVSTENVVKTVLDRQSPGNKLTSPREHATMLGGELRDDGGMSESRARVDPGRAELSLSGRHCPDDNSGDAVGVIDDVDGGDDGDHDGILNAGPSVDGNESSDREELDRTIPRTGPPPGVARQLTRSTNAATPVTRTSRSGVSVSPATVNSSSSSRRKDLSPSRTSASTPTQRISTPPRRTATPAQRTSTPKQRMPTPEQRASPVPTADSPADNSSAHPTTDAVRKAYARLDKLAVSADSCGLASSLAVPTAKSTASLLRSGLAASPKSRVLSRSGHQKQVLPSFAIMTASRASRQSAELPLASSLSQLGKQHGSDATLLTAHHKGSHEALATATSPTTSYSPSTFEFENKKERVEAKDGRESAVGGVRVPLNTFESKEHSPSSPLALDSSLTASRKSSRVDSRNTSPAHTVLEPWDELEARRKAQSRFLRHQRLKLSPDRPSRQQQKKKQQSPYHSSSTPSSSEITDSCSSSDEGEARVGSASVLLGSHAAVSTDAQSLAGSPPMKKIPALSGRQVDAGISSATHVLSPKNHSEIVDANAEVNLGPDHGEKAGQTGSGEGKSGASELRDPNMGVGDGDCTSVDKLHDENGNVGSTGVTTATAETSKSIPSVSTDTSTHHSSQVQNPSSPSHASTRMRTGKSIATDSSPPRYEERRSMSSRRGIKDVLTPTPPDAAPMTVHARASNLTSLNTNGEARAGVRSLSNNDSRRSRLRRSTRATLMAVRRRELMRDSTSRLSLSRSRGSRADFATPMTTPRSDIHSTQLGHSMNHKLNHKSNLGSSRHQAASRPPMSFVGSNSSHLTLQQERRLLREREEKNRSISK